MPFLNPIVKTSNEWNPPDDWIDVLNAADNEINLLATDGGIGVSFAVTVASTGTYTIDWGDGTVETSRASGTIYGHQYTIGAGQAVANYDFTIFKIRIYDATGNITRFQLKKYGTNTNANQAPILIASFGTRYITTYERTFWHSQDTTSPQLRLVQICSFEACSSTLGMFYNCTNLERVILPSSWGTVTNTSFMFINCSSIRNITLPNSWGSVTDPSHMFVNCYALEQLTLPDSWGSITTLYNIFAGCRSLVSIILPSSWGSVNNIDSMFGGCSLLSKITLPSSSNSITSAVGTFYAAGAIREIVNVEYLGSTSNATSFYLFLTTNQGFTGTLTVGAKLSSVWVNGDSQFVNNITGLRLTNATSTWGGGSPQVNVSYTKMDATALNTLFNDIVATGNFSGKTINITGATGAATCDKTIITNAGGIVVG